MHRLSATNSSFSGVWILTGETFPTRTRSYQASLAAGSNWLWNFLLAFFTPFITKNIQFRYGFVFAACNLTGAVIVYFFLYESSELSLESVDMMYCDPNCKPWTSRNWAPEGFANRDDLVEQGRRAENRKSPEATDERLEHSEKTPVGNDFSNSNGHTNGVATNGTAAV